jgi:hypothetical protein
LMLKKNFTLNVDSVNKRRTFLNCRWEENGMYNLLIKPGAVKDIYGNINDSIQTKFMIQQENFYGRILLNAESNKYPIIIQLLNQKESIIASRVIFKPERIVFDYLSPDRYILKAIYDRNSNGEWDTGNYLKKIQPEDVYYNKTPVSLRSDWDYDITWNISE